MTDSLWIDVVGLLVIAVLFGAAIFLAAAETSLVRVHRVRVAALADDGNRRARRLLPLIEQLPHVLNAVLFAALLSQVGAATLTGYLTERRFGNIGVTIGSIMLTFLLFVYAEVIPKTFAVQNPDRVALRVANGVRLLSRILRPIVRGLVWFADLQTPFRTRPSSPTVTEKELRLLAVEAENGGQITHDDRVLLERSFRFGDTTASQIMVERERIVAVPAVSTVGDALELALVNGHRRLPVFESDLDNVVGIVRLRDLAGEEAHHPDRHVRNLASEVVYAEVDENIVVILTRMRLRQTHIAVVRHASRTVGMITIEDIIEELVGDIGDHLPTKGT